MISVNGTFTKTLASTARFVYRFYLNAETC